jgi:predicted PurR-regulated permease PerM
MLATALYPLVEVVHKKFHLLLSIILVLLGLVIPFALIGCFVIPTLIKQLPDLLQAFYNVISHASFLPQSIRSFNLVGYANNHTADILASSPTIFFGFVAVFTIFFSMFYLILDHVQLTKLFLSLFPTKQRDRVNALLNQLAKVNGQYIRGNIIISFICGTVLFIGLLILGVPYALPLAIFASILDLLPLVGSTIGALPAVVIAFTVSPLTGILVSILHLAYQQTENAIISPAIYNKALNLSPALGFLSVVVGGGLFGIIGAFLALPVAASIPVLLHFVHEYGEKGTTHHD